MSTAATFTTSGHAPDRTVVQYQVRLSGSGRDVEQWDDPDVAEDAAEGWRHAGFRAYVVFVENIGGHWVAQED
jgi:hypothetical protein